MLTSLEKSRNSLQTGIGVEPLFMLRCDRSPVMLTCRLGHHARETS